MIKKKLSKEGVKAYEKMSGFETTGAVELHMPSKQTLDLLDKLYEPKGK